MEGANHLWHIDTNHFWRHFVIIGGIDGFQQDDNILKMHTQCADNNTSNTVLQCIFSGIPFRVRSNNGLENVKVANYINQNEDQQKWSPVKVHIIKELNNFGEMFMRVCYLSLTTVFGFMEDEPQCPYVKVLLTILACFARCNHFPPDFSDTILRLFWIVRMHTLVCALITVFISLTEWTITF